MAPTWESWHLHLPTFEAAATDQVVRGVIGPAANTLRHWRAAGRWAAPGAWFFVRYWQFGPHVRFRALGLEPDQALHLDELLRVRLTEALAPADGALSPEDYRRLAAPLAAAGEGGQPLALGQLWAPGVYRQPYLPETERYGGQTLVARSEALFQESSELAVAFLRRDPPDAARSGLGLCATQAALEALGDVDRRRRFCRRASDGWRQWAGPGGAESASLPERPEGRIPAPVQRWADQLQAAMAIWRAETTEDKAERLLHSHVHMLHNRLGLSIGQERNHYLVLAGPG